MLSLFRRNRTTLGLDVGSGSLKVVAIDHSGQDPELIYAAHRPVPLNAILDGEVMDLEQVLVVVRELMEGVSFKYQGIVAAVGGRDVIVKRIKRDRMTKEEAAQTITWDAQQYVPFEMSEVQLDFQILDPDGEGPEMDVLLVAAKKDIIESRISFLEQGGARPTKMDVDAFALVNAFTHNYQEAQDGTAVLVNVGYESSTVNVLQGGILVLTRDVAFGSKKLREDLQRFQQLSLEEATDVVEGRHEDPDQFQNILAAGSEDLAVALERAISFLAMEDYRIFFSGGGSLIPSLLEVVTIRLGHEVQLASPFERIQVREGVLDSLEPETSSLMMLATGLALRKDF